MFGTHAIIEAGQRGIHYYDGKPVAIFRPGRYRVKASGGRGRVDSYFAKIPIRQQDVLVELEAALPKQVKEHLYQVSPNEGEVVLVRAEGALIGIVAPGETQAFWKDGRKITAETIDVTEAPALPREAIREVTAIGSNAVLHFTVPKDHKGVVYIDGAPRETLSAGVYAFWDAARGVAVGPCDTDGVLENW